MKIKASIILLFLSAIFFSNCKESGPEPISPTKGTLQIQFIHTWAMDSHVFELNKKLFHPTTSDTLTFTKLMYYVSNIQLKNSDGSWWISPESYYLIDVSKPASMILNIIDIPTGTYSEMKYVMGVDSLRNVSGSQTGALSTANVMFWDWNSGYIMLKAEGISQNSATKSFAFHLGGFSGVNNIVTQKSTNFLGKSLNISDSKMPILAILANPARLWHTSPSLSVTNAIQMPGAKAKVMAKDFYDGITFESLQE